MLSYVRVTLWTMAHHSAGMCWNFPGKNTGVGCHFLLQRIFLTQGLNWRFLHLLHWQAGSFPQVPPGKPWSTIGGWISEKRSSPILCFYKIEVQRWEAISPGPHYLRVSSRTFSWIWYCLRGCRHWPLSVLPTVWTDIIYLWDLSYHGHWWLRAFPPTPLQPLLSSKPAFPVETQLNPSGYIYLSYFKLSASKMDLIISPLFSLHPPLLESLVLHKGIACLTCKLWNHLHHLPSPPQLLALDPSLSPPEITCCFLNCLSLHSPSLPILPFTWALHWPSYWLHACV